MVVLETTLKCIRLFGKSRCLKKVSGGECPGIGRGMHCKDNPAERICDNCNVVGMFCYHCFLVPVVLE